MRLQLRLVGTAERLFQKLIERLGASQKDVVLDALALYDFATKEIAAGRQIGSYQASKKEFTAITTHMLEAARDTKEQKEHHMLSR